MMIQYYNITLTLIFPPKNSDSKLNFCMNLLVIFCVILIVNGNEKRIVIHESKTASHRKAKLPGQPSLPQIILSKKPRKIGVF